MKKSLVLCSPLSHNARKFFIKPRQTPCIQSGTNPSTRLKSLKSMNMEAPFTPFTYVNTQCTVHTKRVQWLNTTCTCKWYYNIYFKWHYYFNNNNKQVLKNAFHITSRSQCFLQSCRSLAWNVNIRNSVQSDLVLFTRDMLMHWEICWLHLYLWPLCFWPTYLFY